MKTYRSEGRTADVDAAAESTDKQAAAESLANYYSRKAAERLADSVDMSQSQAAEFVRLILMAATYIDKSIKYRGAAPKVATVPDGQSPEDEGFSV